MDYKHTRTGLILICISQIIALVSTLFSGFITIIKMVATNDDMSYIIEEPAVGWLVLIGGSLAVLLTALMGIMCTVGILMSAKAEKKFRSAFFLMLFGIAVTIALYCVSIDSIDDARLVFIDVMQLVVTLTIIEGIIRLAERLEDQKTADYGNFAVKVIATGYVINMLCSICALIFNASYSYKTVGAVLSISSVVIETGIGIFCLITLGKAIKMLSVQIGKTKTTPKPTDESELPAEPAV